MPPVVASQEKYVKLLGMLPPITKMDKEITTLTACEHLGLSTNAIEKIGPGLKELKNLKILSLGRNAIRKLEQLANELERISHLCDGGSGGCCKVLTALGDHSQCAGDHG